MMVESLVLPNLIFFGCHFDLSRLLFDIAIFLHCYIQEIYELSRDNKQDHNSSSIP